MSQLSALSMKPIDKIQPYLRVLLIGKPQVGFFDLTSSFSRCRGMHSPSKVGMKLAEHTA